MEQKLLQLRNEEYQKIHSQWRKIHFNILIVSVIAIAIAIIEGMMFFVVGKMGLIHCTVREYLDKYLFFPIICNLVLLYASFLVLKSRRLSEHVKNYFISLAIVAVAFVLSVVHGIFIAVYVAGVISVMLTNIYGQKKLTTITALVCFVTQLISAYWIHWDMDKIYDELYPINITIFLIILGCVYAICIVTIEWEEKKQNTILEKEMERQQLKHQVKRDGLTGLYNRLGLRECFSNIQENGIVDYYFVMIDIDHFKKVNDTWGHSAGDFALESLGKILLQEESDDFIPFRFGGDEFSILILDNALDQVIAKCERIQQLYKESVFVQIQGHEFSISMGIAHNKGNLDPSKLIEHADDALYEMKCKSRGCISVYQGDENEL